MRPGSICHTWLILCFLVFFAISAIAGGGALLSSSIAPYVAVRSWAETRAKITSVSIEQFSRVRLQTGLCRVIYTYIVNGTEYHGTRASLYERGAGSFEVSICHRLQTAKIEDTATCFYDPHHPEMSVLNRSLRHDLFCGALLILLILGGAGVFAVAHWVDKLRRRVRTNRRRIESKERQWPLVALAVGGYATVVGLLAVSLGGMSVAQSDMDGLWTLSFGLLFFGVVIFCLHWISRCRNASELVFHEKRGGGATLRIPRYSGGNVVLMGQWVHRTGTFGTAKAGEATELIPVDVHDNGAGWTEIEMEHLPRVSDSINDDAMLFLKVTGVVGEEQYTGRFDCGTYYELERLQSPELVRD